MYHTVNLIGEYFNLDASNNQFPHLLWLLLVPEIIFNFRWEIINSVIYYPVLSPISKSNYEGKSETLCKQFIHITVWFSKEILILYDQFKNHIFPWIFGVRLLKALSISWKCVTWEGHLKSYKLSLYYQCNEETILILLTHELKYFPWLRERECAWKSSLWTSAHSLTWHNEKIFSP